MKYLLIFLLLSCSKPTASPAPTKEHYDTSSCTSCHIKLPHTQEFKDGEHYEVATTYKGGCLNCHEEKVCLECHDGQLTITWN